jgi:hypothetical protein
MKRSILIHVVLVFLLLAGVVAYAGGGADSQTCDTACAQAALLRIGMNLEVAERIRKGDMDGALRLLNTMNTVEVTPLLSSSEDTQLDAMKRRIFRKLIGERSRAPSPRAEDKETIELNRDIDSYLKKYP